MINVGLLFDSLSNNSGDKAIGIALEEYCQRENFPYEVINPFTYDKSRYSSVIVGGGFLIREPGDPFYDKFRIEGNHILNSIGMAAKTELAYLNDYSYVSVRSAYEKSILEGIVEDVAIVPCVTTLMEGSSISGTLPNFSPRCVGVHLVADTVTNCPDLLDAIYELPQDKVFIPFTHYNKDRSLMGALPSIEKHLLLDDLDPKQLYSVVGKMEMVITSSLHVSIFAYLQNIPFLTFYQQKTYDYFKDRGLEDHVFRTTEEFKEKLHTIILDKKVDFSEQVNNDKVAVRKHLSKMSDIIKRDGHKFNESTLGDVATRESLPEDILSIDQLNHVIASRDILIKKLYEKIYSS